MKSAKRIDRMVAPMLIVDRSELRWAPPLNSRAPEIHEQCRGSPHRAPRGERV